MKRKVIMRFAVAGVSLLLTGALAVSTVDQLLIEPLTVDSLGGLVEKYLQFRELHGPIVPPGAMYQDVAEQMSTGDWSFLKENWFFTFDDGVLYVPEKSELARGLELPVRIQAREDLKTGQIYIFSAPLSDGETGEFSGLAALKAPEFMEYEKDFPMERYLFDELSPRRVVWEVTLKSEADAWADLIFQREETGASKLLEGGGMMAAMSVPEEHTNDIWLCLDPQNEQINLLIYAPEGFTNRVEVYSCTDLVSGAWNVAGQNLYPSGTNPAVWDAGGYAVYFLAVGSMDVDEDADGLPNARELYVYKTDPNNPDTDGDGYSDGPAWPAGYTNAIRGINDAFPLEASVWRDTDGDGLPNEVVGTSTLTEDLDDNGDGTNEFLFSSIWISAEEIAGLATTGAQWENLVEDANEPFIVDISDQDDDANVYTMAKALVYARTGIESYRTDVIDACMEAIGTEAGGESLALGRNLGAFVIAAELVGFPREKDMLFRDWLQAVRTNVMTDGRSLITCHEQRPNNWGAHAGGSRAAVDVYLQDWDDLADTARIFKGYLGDTNSYNSFTFGGLWWQADTNNPVGINPQGSAIQGHNVDGVLPEEMRRETTPGGSPTPFTWPPPYQNYVYEALQGVLLQAVILSRAGCDVWNWEDQAILRAFTWKHDVAGYPPVGDDNWEPFIINHYYGTGFQTTNVSSHGKNVAPTCWTHQVP